MSETLPIHKQITEKILDTFIMDQLPREEQISIFALVSDGVFQAVLLRIIPTLEPEDKSKYDELISSEVNPEQLLEFLSRSVPFFLEMVYEEINNLAKTLKIENPKVLKKLSEEKQLVALRASLLKQFNSGRPASDELTI